jgi:MIP family channel proteins
MNSTLLRNALSEFVGTFALVLGIGGTTMIAYANGGRVIDIAIASGIVITLFTSLFQRNGAQFNPAISIALLFTRRIGALTAGVNIVVQLGGAIVAAFLVSTLYPEQVVTATRAGGTVISMAVPAVSAWGLEFIAGFLLMFVYCGSIIDTQRARLAGLPMGMVVALNTMLMAPLTGASMNPARTVGPALVSGIFEGLAIFLTAPVIGAIIGALLYEFVFLDRSATPAS